MKTLLTFTGFLLFTAGLCVSFSALGDVLLLKRLGLSLTTLSLGIGSAWAGLFILGKTAIMAEKSQYNRTKKRIG